MVKRKWTQEEIIEYRKKNGFLFYFNKKDSNFLVPKSFGFGWTLNWANPISWLTILVVVSLICFRKLF